MNLQARVRELVEAGSAAHIETLRESCSIPSVSAEGTGLTEMAAWLEDRLVALGATVTRLSVPGSPDALLGELPGPGDRALMIYDHYDVQPVDPIELWESPPFELTERDGRLFARGAADNKGDLMARLQAIEAYRELFGEIPFSIKFFIEGEEESGSAYFDEICRTHAGRLEADECIWEGAWSDHDGRPSMYFGCKGLLYLELRKRALAGDQHSSIAVYAPSAAWDLLQAVASTKDEGGHIAIDGFHDSLITPTMEEKELIEGLDFNEDAVKSQLGITAFAGGLTGYQLKESLLYSPTVNIAGFHTGYAVPGGQKTVLPAEAMAKLDFRLVPDQDAHDIAEKFRAHLKRHGFEDIEVEVLSSENPSRSPVDSRLGASVRRAAEQWFEKPATVYPLMWATGPMYPIAQGLGIPICSPPGVGRIDSNLHAPNENVRVADYLSTIGFTVAYLKEYGEPVEAE